MGTLTVPALPNSITRAEADAVVSYIADHAPHHHAYPHAWGNDWGVTITSPSESDEALRSFYRTLVFVLPLARRKGVRAPPADLVAM